MTTTDRELSRDKHDAIVETIRVKTLKLQEGNTEKGQILEILGEMDELNNEIIRDKENHSQKCIAILKESRDFNSNWLEERQKEWEQSCEYIERKIKHYEDLNLELENALLDVEKQKAQLNENEHELIQKKNIFYAHLADYLSRCFGFIGRSLANHRIQIVNIDYRDRHQHERAIKIMEKQLFNYYGGKARIASKIATIVDSIPHHLYCEPFCGGASVLYAKRQSRIEILNDKDERLITLYREFQDNYDALVNKLNYTLYSESEYAKAKNILQNWENYSSLDQAWAIYVQCNCSFGHAMLGGWARSKIPSRPEPRVWNNRKKALPDILERLKDINLACSDRP